MEKLWRWEEKSIQQNKKRKILWTAAVLAWLAALYVTYWVEHTLYGEENGEPCRFLVDFKDGKILLAATEKEEPELGNWYR